MATGVLPKQHIRRLFDAGYITGVDEKYLNPASLDLPLSDEVFRIRGTFLPQRGQSVRLMLKEAEAIAHDVNVACEPGVSYLARVEGIWRTSELVYGYANPKSSSGRLGFLCRTIADGVDMYDSLPRGFQGELWMLMRPEFFPIKLYKGVTLAQMRFFNGKSFIDELEMEMESKQHGLFFDPERRKIPFEKLLKHGDSLYMTLNVEGTVGWVSRRDPARVLELAKVGKHDPRDFFEPVEAINRTFSIEMGRLYILTTAERMLVPPHLSCELRAVDVRLGDFRSHAAGYIDPGWGWGHGEKPVGRPITLELITYENMVVQRGQKIARARYERMREIPELLYDDAGSNYSAQEGPQLSKHFKREPAT